ncbi:MAG TPA: hypothetical protein VIL74_00470 [Pyrinomonadaceae bacterium]|jgi:hypothetical protein
MKKRLAQIGNSDVILIFTFALIFILAIVGLPKFLKWREDSKIPVEIRALRKIHAAETKYRTQISLKNTFGNFKQLAETKTLPDCPGCLENSYQIDGLQFEMVRNYEETRFCVRTAKYAMDADGRIYEGASCAMGEVAGDKSKEFIVK